MMFVPFLLLISSIHHVSGLHQGDHLNLTNWTAADHWPAGGINCAKGYRVFKELTQKRVYYIGVHAESGIEHAWQEFNLTFETYLNEAVGKRWTPPIEFKMKTTAHPLESWIDDNEEIDFMYSDTGVYSCFGTEIGAQPLATTVAHLTARGKEHDLDIMGGAILVRADNFEITDIDDVHNKIIGAQEFSDFAGAQSQFYVMYKNGMDYIMDPKQVVFTANGEETVRGVLDGRWDVGFVRTGQVERTYLNETLNEKVDPDLFKVIEPKIYVMDNKDIFPFLHSTPVFPEWPFYAKKNVDREVAEEVAFAMINFQHHEIVGERIHACMDQAKNFMDMDICKTTPIVQFDETARCDTDRGIAEIAYQAGKAGRILGFRSPRSHFQLRTMQQDAGFIVKNHNGDWHCERASSTYDGVVCPEGYYKVKESDFDEQCDKIGQPCPEGMHCYCRPCIKAFEVDVLHWDEVTLKNHTSLNHDKGCDKMDLCGSVEQTKTIIFRAFDNVGRDNATLTALIHVGHESRYLDVLKLEEYSYEFSFSNAMRGVAILEVFIDDVQIPESPFRVEVVERDCDADFPGLNMDATDTGFCECSSDSLQINGRCLSEGIFAAIVASVFVVIAAQVGWCYLGYRRRKNDEMWQVTTDELDFSIPVEIIGQGGFGVVLLAEYRGTKVAIKRVLPLQGQGKGTVKKSGSNMFGSNVKTSDTKTVDVKASEQDSDKASSLKQGDIESGNGGSGSLGGSRRGSIQQGTSSIGRSSTGNLDFLGGLSVGEKPTGLRRWLPFLFPDEGFAYNSNILSSATGGSTTTRSLFARVFPWCDETARRQEEFKAEMRLLSRLRHPSITTVMGAVMNGYEPMMVMEYMENGSLYDLLQNETLYTGGEIIVQIVRDISQGLRFLHASKPPILHGDLKAKNILIDSRFRAKVADFGLATKSGRGLAGTPFWMAPEYLRRKTEYNTACDIYSFGIIMYEIYSRKPPYEGEHPRKVLRKVCDPRLKYRPPVPSTCPKRMTEIMQKCWSSDAYSRPEAKDLDLLFSDMTASDCEPVIEQGNTRLRTQVATGDMLYKVFPKKVADQLKAGQKVEPETHDNVTVFFSDIIRFTDISRALSPVKVCYMLDRLYLAFDELANKHDVFKVETIGDAWMGVTNLEDNQKDTHVKRIAEFAVDAVAAANKILIDEDDPLAGHIHIRVGFHSGMVVSNVIGSLNPRYGLFGDTVNTASRMESNSVSGRIHCSEASAMILKEQAPDFPLMKRGKVSVKGKGTMITYWVGDKVLKEVGNLSMANVYDEQPVVGFVDEALITPEPKRRVRSGTKRPPVRVAMDGSLNQSSTSEMLRSEVTSLPIHLSLDQKAPLSARGLGRRAYTAPLNHHKSRTRSLSQ